MADSRLSRDDTTDVRRSAVCADTQRRGQGMLLLGRRATRRLFSSRWLCLMSKSLSSSPKGFSSSSRCKVQRPEGEPEEGRKEDKPDAARFKKKFKKKFGEFFEKVKKCSKRFKKVQKSTKRVQKEFKKKNKFKTSSKKHSCEKKLQ